MERFILGIDIGTTSVKTVLVSSVGKIVDEASASHNLLSPFPGWAEESADCWWTNTQRTIRELIARNSEAIKKVECIGVTGMVPAIVMLDRSGTPIRNAIQQNDARAVKQIGEITFKIDQDMLYQRTGSITNQQHVLPRIMWVRENEPEVFSRLAHVLGSYDYVVFKLTGELSLELNWAAESGLFDIRRREWLTDQIEAFGFKLEWFPQVNDSLSIVGNVTQTAAETTGLKPGIPVIAGSADHVASTLSAGIIQQGDLLIKFGGAGDILYCTEDIVTSPKLFFDYHIVPNRYLLNGCMAASGSLVKWYLNNILGSYNGAILKALDEEASNLPPASDGLVILPYFLGEKTPVFDPLARGMIFGLTLSHTKAHIFRACLEAVIYGFKHHIDTIEEIGYRPLRIIATDGGTKSSFWCQIAADVLGHKIQAYSSHPGSALGVAFLAGMAVNAFSNWEQIHLFLQEYDVYLPNQEATTIYEKAYKVYRNLYLETKPSCEAISNLYQ